MVLAIEYRIPLPLTASEYRIAQLYMLAKKSRQESHGEGSGIEILVNEPYEDGPGPDGKGQYTRKVYHVGSHLPTWVKSMIPKSALSVEEEAWNAYPYTKTRFTCPFLEKFNIEVETYYFDDGGHQENVFKLSKNEIKQREVDIIDIVKDQLYGADYIEDEDPRTFVSQKTNRGPLSEEWIKDYWAECQGKQTPLPNGKAIMCAYKLCRVEFRYWGMQTKIEKFIHDVALRKTMLRAHRQAWAWIDEWWGLSINDIRSIERETQAHLAKKFGAATEGSDQEEEEEEEEEEEVDSSPDSLLKKLPESSSLSSELTIGSHTLLHPRNSPKLESSDQECDEISPKIKRRERGLSSATEVSFNDDARKRSSWSRSGSRVTLNSYNQGGVNWRMESIRRDSVSTESDDDEFFDCQEDVEESACSLHKWSSLELLPQEDAHHVNATPGPTNDSIFSHTCMSRIAAERQRHIYGRSFDTSVPPSPSLSPSHQPDPCVTTILLIVVHAGSVLEINSESASKKSDLTTFRGALESVIRQHYAHLAGRVTIRLISAPPVCSDSLNVLTSLTPFGLDHKLANDNCNSEQVPVGALPVLGILSPDYEETVSKVVMALNSTYHEFLHSDEGLGFSGQVCFIGDSVGGILCYDALCRGVEIPRHAWTPHCAEGEPPSPGDDEQGHRPTRKSCGSESTPHSDLYHSSRSASDSDYHCTRHLSAPCPRRRSSASSELGIGKLEFEVSDVFLFGCPLAIILVYRKMMSIHDRTCSIPRPACQQIYNLFHPTDPLAVRLEPLISARFSLLQPVSIPRYTKYPLGDGSPTNLLECIQAHGNVFLESGNPPMPQLYANGRKLSDASILSTVSGIADSVPLATITALSQRWWGTKRLDYALYCPEGLSNFSSSVLPHLFHASYWESYDVIAFILRQLVRGGQSTISDEKEISVFLPSQPREKWQRKRTSVKLKNIAANHRGNDIIVKEGSPQQLGARFMYGPLDMVALSGEKVDVHVMRDPPSGDWQFIAACVTDKSGRISAQVPSDKHLSYGMYPVKMIVRGDHTTCSLYLAVVPPKTECVVFSIDGSFTASVSVTGKDPKVRAGAVDVVRHWQELGYLIIYITGRPDMQQHKVVSWLAQHNFPHGLVSFADGLSTDPLGHKADYLRGIQQECGVSIEAAYGSSKDISVYTSIGLKSEQIYIVGKVSKKQQISCQVLTDGYAAHLNQLLSLGKARPAKGNPEMVIPKGFFGLPGQNNALRRRRSAKRTTSYPVMGTSPSEGILHSRTAFPHMSMKC